MLVLRKSVRQFSAGTRVTLVSIEPKAPLVTVEAAYTKSTRVSDYMGKDKLVYKSVTETFDVPTSDLVELRPRSELVPLKNKEARRCDKKFVKEQMAKLTGGTSG
jgi:hypothetical protein